MSLKYIYTCDNCDKEQEKVSIPGGWVCVRSGTFIEQSNIRIDRILLEADRDDLHFCSVGCLLAKIEDKMPKNKTDADRVGRKPINYGNPQA